MDGEVTREFERDATKPKSRHFRLWQPHNIVMPQAVYGRYGAGTFQSKDVILYHSFVSAVHILDGSLN